jgi:hypothetical protein
MDHLDADFLREAVELRSAMSWPISSAAFALTFLSAMRRWPMSISPAW